MIWRAMSVFSIVAVVVFMPVAATAGFQIDVTTADGWTEGLDRIAIVTEECADSMNCRDVEERLALQVQNAWRKHAKIAPGERGIQIVRPAEITEALMKAGLTEYDPDLQDELIRELDVNALMVIKVPSGRKGQSGFTARGSEAKVDLHITNGDSLLLVGSGSGRARNTLTSPEKVAATIGEKIFEKALAEMGK